MIQINYCRLSVEFSNNTGGRDDSVLICFATGNKRRRTKMDNFDLKGVLHKVTSNATILWKDIILKE